MPPIQILMPALSPTMTEGNLLRWLKKEGDRVKAGELLAEIETDKATMELEAADDGILAKIIVPEGTENVRVNHLIALLAEDGEELSALEDYPRMPESTAVPSFASPPAALAATPPQPAPPPPQGSRIIASPLAKRLAKAHNLDMLNIQGSGPKGRIIERDIHNSLTEVTSASPLAVKPRLGSTPYKEIPLTKVRKVIAQRLTEAKQTIPHFYLTIDCELDALLQLRLEANTSLGEEKLSLNDFFIRAVALALKRVPQTNVTWHETSLRQYEWADVAVAVAAEEGLYTPIIRKADHKSVREISREISALAARARAGKLTPEEYQGGSFTISNLGMYGIKEFAAILNPPQACILAIGKGEKQPIIKENVLKTATVMRCTLSVDHRAVDGALGGRFLAVFKELVESPILLVV